MTQADDEYGKRVLAPLQNTPPLDNQVAAEEKARYLLRAENLRHGPIPAISQEEKQKEPGPVTGYHNYRLSPLLRSLVAVLIALIFLVASSLTVYAAQDSLPGEALYPFKEISEDIRLSLTHSPQARLDLTLEYTYRRMDEIKKLMETGKTLPSQASERFQGELESALQLVTQLEDSQMQKALWEIKKHAENQGMTIEELINQLPKQAEPAIIRLQERLREQIELSTIGEDDPQTFRQEIRERQRLNSRKHKTTPDDHDASSKPTDSYTPPPPAGDEVEQDKGREQSTQLPDSDGTDPGQGNPDPGNGNHEPDPSKPPKP
jgi:hypothetical protein